MKRSRSDLDALGENTAFELVQAEWPILDVIPEPKPPSPKNDVKREPVELLELSALEFEKDNKFDTKRSKRKPKRKLSASNLFSEL